MKRRNFLSLLGAGTAVLAFPLKWEAPPREIIESEEPRNPVGAPCTCSVSNARAYIQIDEDKFELYSFQIDTNADTYLDFPTVRSEIHHRAYVCASEGCKVFEKFYRIFEKAVVKNISIVLPDSRLDTKAGIYMMNIVAPTPEFTFLEASWRVVS